MGEDRFVKILGYRWLPTPISFSFQSPQHFLAEDTRVMELIDPVTKWWNVPLVHVVVFNEEEANIICNIPRIQVAAKDQLIWRSTSHKEFFVRSTYHMEKELQAMRRCGGSKQQTRNKVWKNIWTLNLPNMAKMFLWKACNDILPKKNDSVSSRGSPGSMISHM
jgi:hypothetical protein